MGCAQAVQQEKNLACVEDGPTHRYWMVSRHYCFCKQHQQKDIGSTAVVMQNHSQSISSSRELLPSTSPSQERVIGRSWLTGESFWLKLSFRNEDASDWHSCVGMVDKQTFPEHWKLEAHHREFYWHWRSDKHRAGGRMYCGGRWRKGEKKWLGWFVSSHCPVPCVV